MLITTLCMLCVLSGLVPTINTSGTITIVISILQVRTLKLRKHTKSKLWSLDWKVGILCPEPGLA